MRDLRLMGSEGSDGKFEGGRVLVLVLLFMKV